MITYARLQNFRAYSDGSFEFDPGVNIVVGPNASGKTTIIEALLVALNGKSFKAGDRELLATNTSWARIDIGTEQNNRIIKLITDNEKVTKTFEIDGKTYKRLPYERTIPVVLFEPNHLLLFHGGPELRRTYLDELITQLEPGHSTILTQYKRVLMQRNALLKQQHHPDKNQLFVWNVRLSELGGKIVANRQNIITKFNEHVSALYSKISGVKTKIVLEYQTPIYQDAYETGLLKALEHNMERDCATGFTSRGPHREDLKLHINSQVVGEVASRGEMRTIVLTLKMLEAQFIEAARSKKPLLLFDDVFSELDGKRRQALVHFLKPYQSVITTTDADIVIEHFTTSHLIPTS